MNFFWVIFSVVFIAGSVGIYVAAPVAGPRVVAYFRSEVPSAGDALPAVPAGAGNAQDEAPEPVAPAAEVALRTLDDGEVSPALEGVFLARASEQPGWGVTSHKTPCYKADGAYAGTVEGGLLFDCAGSYTSSKGSMVECRFLKDEGAGDAVFIGRKDALFFTESHRKLSKARIRAMADYYTLNGKIEVRRAELLEKGAGQNPYFAAARAAHEAFQKNIQEAKRLEQSRDTLTGTKRMALEDQLRELKLKEVALKKTFEEKQDAFLAWKTAHADELPKPEDDADIQAWTREKKRLAAALPGLAY